MLVWNDTKYMLKKDYLIVVEIRQFPDEMAGKTDSPL
jgi:hypothetical protein